MKVALSTRYKASSTFVPSLSSVRAPTLKLDPIDPIKIDDGESTSVPLSIVVKIEHYQSLNLNPTIKHPLLVSNPSN